MTTRSLLLCVTGILILSFIAACSSGDTSNETCFQNVQSNEITNSDFNVHTRLIRTGVTTIVDVAISVSPIIPNTHVNGIDLVDGDRLEMRVDGQTYILTPAGSFPGSGFELSNCEQGVLGYTANIMLEQNIDYDVHLVIRRVSEEDISIDFLLPKTFELFEPLTPQETFDPTQDNVLIAWASSLSGDIDFNLRDDNNCFIYTRVLAETVQQLLVSPSLEFSLSDSCSNETAVNLELRSRSTTELISQANIPINQIATVISYYERIPIADNLVY